MLHTVEGPFQSCNPSQNKTSKLHFFKFKVQFSFFKVLLVWHSNKLRIELYFNKIG